MSPNDGVPGCAAMGSQETSHQHGEMHSDDCRITVEVKSGNVTAASATGHQCHPVRLSVPALLFRPHACVPGGHRQINSLTTEQSCVRRMNAWVLHHQNSDHSNQSNADCSLRANNNCSLWASRNRSSLLNPRLAASCKIDSVAGSQATEG